MRSLPLDDPGCPDLRGPGRYLAWVVRGQMGTVAGGVLWGVVWMGSQALAPALLGRAVQQGLVAGDRQALLTWTGALLGVGLLQSAAGVLRHRFAVTNWLVAAMRTQQLVTRQVAGLGATLPRRVAAGEVVTLSATDAPAVGNALDITARGAGAVVSFVIVALALLTTSVPLGLLVLIGVPVVMLAVTPVVRPLQRRQSRQRELVGQLTGLGADTVAGLRVLRGIGGEETFTRRYRARSQQVRAAGVGVARLQSLLDAQQVLLPGGFVVLVTWLGARAAVQGRLDVGDLVAFYGYAAFLVLPLRTGIEAVDKILKGLVAARRVVRVLAVEPDLPAPAAPAAPPAPGGALVDPQTGLVVRAGRLTAVVCTEPGAGSALADRLGRYTDSPATLGGVALADLPVDLVRQRVLVGDAEPVLFSGPLRDQLDPTGRHGAERIGWAIRAAVAADVLDALPDGLDSPLTERGRSLSGGQRQRLVLARALLADPEVLILDEPTSAVDAHTEAAIADRLRTARAGRTTVVLTASPLLLDRADEAVLVADGAVVAAGTHRALLRDCPGYRSAVLRGVPA